MVKSKSRKITKRKSVMKKTTNKNKDATIKKKGGARLLNNKFMDGMVDNMWQFMGPETITEVLNQSGCNTKFKFKKDIDDDNWSRYYNNSFVFKGPREEGHYVYIDATGKVYGTYECDILASDKDDGICHGFALAAALNDCGLNVGQIILNPKSNEDKKINYITIMNAYKIIVEKGWWDNALEKHFRKEITLLAKNNNNIRTEQSSNAIKLLENLKL